MLRGDEAISACISASDAAVSPKASIALILWEVRPRSFPSARSMRSSMPSERRSDSGSRFSWSDSTSFTATSGLVGLSESTIVQTRIASLVFPSELLIIP